MSLAASSGQDGVLQASTADAQQKGDAGTFIQEREIAEDIGQRKTNTEEPIDVSQLNKISAEVFTDMVIPNQHFLKKNWAYRILDLPGFENAISFFIVLNLVVMIVETDKEASQEESADLDIHWTGVFSWIALVIFALELLVRMIAHGCHFWHDPMNIWDVAVIATDAVFSIAGLVVGDLFPVSVLRVFRLTKLARVSKVLRVFPELRLLLAGLFSSVRTIFWGTLLLFLFLLIWSMVAVQMIYPLAKNVDYGDCDRCARAYSSVMQATLTFWQQIITGDSWGQVTIPIIEEHPSTALFFLPVFMSVGMALMNLILGVVINAAQTAYEDLEHEEKAAKALLRLEKQSHVLELCRQMDVDHSGELSHDELFSGFTEPGEFRDFVLALDLTEEDFNIAYATMDVNRSGSVSYKEFVTYIATMKSSDINFMLSYIKYYVSWIKDELVERLSKQHAEAMDKENKLQKDLEIVQQEELAIIETEQKGEAILRRSGSLPDLPDVFSKPKNQNQIAEQTPHQTQAKSAQEVEPIVDNPMKAQRQVIGANIVKNPLSAGSSPITTKAESRSSGQSNDDNSAVMLADMSNMVQVLLQQISNDVGKLRVELSDTWMNINHRFDLLVTPAYSTRDVVKDVAKVDPSIAHGGESYCGNSRCTI